MKLLKANEFSVETGKQRLASIQLSDQPPNLTSRERIAYLSNIIETENTQMVRYNPQTDQKIRAAGALLAFLLTNKIVNQLEDNGAPLVINAIKSFSMERCLNMDANTLEALQIFVNEDHPCLLGKGKAKEGLSLFGIMDHTVKRQERTIIFLLEIWEP